MTSRSVASPLILASCSGQGRQRLSLAQADLLFVSRLALNSPTAIEPKEKCIQQADSIISCTGPQTFEPNNL
jgi:hypothetical protein